MLYSIHRRNFITEEQSDSFYSVQEAVAEDVVAGDVLCLARRRASTRTLERVGEGEREGEEEEEEEGGEEGGKEARVRRWIPVTVLHLLGHLIM